MNYDINIPDHVVNYPKIEFKTDIKETESSIFSQKNEVDPNIPDNVVSQKEDIPYLKSYVGNYEGLEVFNTFSPFDNPDITQLKESKNIVDSNAQIMMHHIINIYNGSYNDNELKSLQREYSVLSAELEDKIANDNSIPENIKNAYLDNLSSLESVNSLKTDTMNAKIKAAEQEKVIEEKKEELERLNLRLSTIPEEEKEAFPKDREMQKHIKWSRNDLKSEIEDLEDEIAKQEEILNDLNNDYENKKLKSDEAVKTIPHFENQNKALVAKISKYCSKETQSVVSEFEKTRSNLEKRKEYIIEDASFRLKRFEETSDDMSNKIEEEKQNNPVKYENVRNDLFKENLIKKLDKWNPDSILYDYIDTIIEMSDKYDIEPELLGGIICKETGWGTSKLCREAYNFGGVRYDDDFGDGKYLAPDGNYYVKYSSPYEGIEAVAQTLSDYPGNEPGIDAIDMYNINNICDVYAEGSDDWHYDVKEFYCGLRWG